MFAEGTRSVRGSRQLKVVLFLSLGCAGEDIPRSRPVAGRVGAIARPVAVGQDLVSRSSNVEE
jgi:hypothetical protein